MSLNSKLYNIQNLLDIQRYLDIRNSDYGDRFKNYKYYLLKKDTNITSKITTGISYNVLLQDLIKYNFLSNPGCYSNTFDSCITVDGEKYDASTTEMIMGRLGTKIRVKVCNTYTINNQETTDCHYELRDAFVVSNCSSCDCDLSDLLGKITSFANPVN